MRIGTKEASGRVSLLARGSADVLWKWVIVRAGRTGPSQLRTMQTTIRNQVVDGWRSHYRAIVGRVSPTAFWNYRAAPSVELYSGVYATRALTSRIFFPPAKIGWRAERCTETLAIRAVDRKRQVPKTAVVRIVYGQPQLAISLSLFLLFPF